MDLKICIMPYRRSSSGIAAYTLELTQALNSANIKVSIATFGLSPSQKLRLENLGVDVIEVNPRDPTEYMLLGGPLLEHMVLSKKLRKKLMEKEVLRKIDILHFTLAPTSLAFRNSDVIVTSWNPNANLVEASKPLLKFFKFPFNAITCIGGVEYYIGDRMAFEEATKIICCTQWVAQRRGIEYPEKVSYIPPPIRAHETPYPRYDNSASILYISRDLDMPRKNLATFLDAVALLTKQEKNFSVTLIGRYSKKLEHTVEAIKRRVGVDIKLIGYLLREELERAYISSNIFVSTSLYEELSYVVLEAMAHGLPIVASNIFAFRDLIDQDRNGFLVPPKDAASLAVALKKLTDEPKLRRKMGLESLSIARERYGYEVVANKLIRLYESIAKN